MNQVESAGKILLRVGVRGIAAALPGGFLVGALFEEVALPFANSVWDWLKGQPPAEQQAAIDALAVLSVTEARAVAQSELPEARLASVQREALVNYLSAVPMTARRAISRPNDHGQPSVLLSQLPRSRASVLGLLPLRPPRFQPGHRVPAHDFELEVLLGQGGFGEVWKARHVRRKAEAPRAFKFCLEPSMQVSLDRELDLLDRIEMEGRHEGIVQLLGTALSADPPFLMYEYVDGGNLVAWLASFEGAAPPAHELVRVLKMTSEALAFAHERGIVHLDLKPANLLVTRAGRVKIADFGIGRTVAENEALREQSQAMASMSALQGACTPLYADRAQQRGERVDARADVYALGVIAYQLLMGDVTLALTSYWREELEERELPADLVALIGACVSLPSRRLADARAVLAQLGKLAIPRAVPEPQPGPLGKSAGARPAEAKPGADRGPAQKPPAEVKPPADKGAGQRPPADKGAGQRPPAEGKPKADKAASQRPPLRCKDCGRPYKTRKGLDRHTAVHGPAAGQAPPPEGSSRLEIDFVSNSELQGRISPTLAPSIFTARSVQSAAIIAYIAEATGATVQQSAAAVDGFWGYVTNVRDHYTHAASPYLVIPGFGTFRVRKAKYRPRHKSLTFRSQTSEHRGGRMVELPGYGYTLIGWSPDRPPVAAAAAPPPPAPEPELPKKGGSWYQRLSSLLGSAAAPPQVRAPAAAPPQARAPAAAPPQARAPAPSLPAQRRASVVEPVNPFSVGWTSTVLSGGATRRQLSVRRRIATYISAAAGLPLPLASQLLDRLLQAMQLVFDRKTPTLTWAKRGVMFPARSRYFRDPSSGRIRALAGGRYYTFRGYAAFERRLLV